MQQHTLTRELGTAIEIIHGTPNQTSLLHKVAACEGGVGGGESPVRERREEVRDEGKEKREGEE